MDSLVSHIRVVETQDGSLTCFNNNVQEHYHNLSGAYHEALNVYITPAKLEERLTACKHLCILDPFFGMGYNTLACLQTFSRLRKSQFPDATLTMICCENDPEILTYLPLTIESANQDDLKQFLPLFEHKIYYQTQQIDEQLKNGEGKFNDMGIHVRMIVGDTRQIIQHLPKGIIDLIFHDAFSPRKQPELWTKQLFKHYLAVLKSENSCVMTYSAAACVRKALLENGFCVYPLPIKNYKSGTMASTSALVNQPSFSELELALMNSRSGIPYEDNETLSLSKEAVIQNRQILNDKSSLPSSSAIHRQFGSKF